MKTQIHALDLHIHQLRQLPALDRVQRLHDMSDERIDALTHRLGQLHSRPSSRQQRLDRLAEALSRPSSQAPAKAYAAKKKQRVQRILGPQAKSPIVPVWPAAPIRPDLVASR